MPATKKKAKVKVVISKSAPAPPVQEPVQQALPGCEAEQTHEFGNDPQDEELEAVITALDGERERRMASQKREAMYQDQVIAVLEASGERKSYHRGNFAAWIVVEGKLKKKAKVRAPKTDN
jgi:hypothetical protein